MPASRSSPPAAQTLHVAEPPGAYAQRRLLVVDASVLAAVLFGESRHALALGMLQVCALAAPHLLDSEIGSVALKKMRLERQPADRIARALQLYGALDMSRHPIDAAAAVAIAHRWEITAYDAAYLWLAEHLQAPLATFDDQLAAAARAHLSPPQAPDDHA
jgi:predicted nucleic acid-binding protein